MFGSAARPERFEAAIHVVGKLESQKLFFPARIPPTLEINRNFSQNM